MCFVTDIAIQDALEQVQAKGVTIIAGIVDRLGANGPIQSFYFRDPDGNLIELSAYH